MSLRSKVALALITMYIAWGTTYLAIAYVIQTMPDLMSMGVRFLAAGAIQYLLVSLVSGAAQFRVTPRQLRNSVLLGIFMLAAGIGAVSTAEHVVPVGVVALIVSSMPLWTALLRISDGDRPSRMTLIGIAAGFAGLVIVMQPNSTIPREGANGIHMTLLMLVLIAGNIMWSVGSFLTPRIDKPGPPLVLTTYEMLAAGVALIVVGMCRGQRLSDLTHGSATSWAAWWYLVLIGSVVGYTTYNWLLGHAPISLVATYSYVNPVVALVLAAVLFSEPIGTRIVFGGALILSAVALVAASERVTPSRAAG